MRLLAAAVAVLPFCFAQDRLSPTQVTDIEKLFVREMSAQHIPGMSVAVALGDEIWTKGYGFADLENFVPAQASTLYRTASVVKPMTAVAAMQLVEQGTLDLDAPIQKYLPAFPQKHWPISMRQLLGHLGGVRSYRDGAESYITRHYWNLDSALQVFANDDLVAEPGTKYVYSTFGYVLAGRVVEAVAGVPFVEYMQKKVFAPAGMSRTQPDDVYQIIPGRARGYQRLGDGELRNAALADTSHKIPGGGYLSTAGDLVRFVIAVDKGRLLKAPSVAAMLESLVSRDGKQTGYGLGWGTNDWNGMRYYTHGGGQAGVSTVMAYLPTLHAAVGIMINLEGLTLQPLVQQLLEIVTRQG